MGFLKFFSLYCYFELKFVLNPESELESIFVCTSIVIVSKGDSSERCFLQIYLYNCRPGSTSTATIKKSVPSENSSTKRNGSINANSGSIHNATKKGNTAGEQNASETAKKANPKAVLANEKKAATQLGVIVGMKKINCFFL